MKLDSKIYMPEEVENTLRLQKVERMTQPMKSMKTNEEAEMLSLEEINQLVHELRN